MKLSLSKTRTTCQTQAAEPRSGWMNGLNIGSAFATWKAMPKVSWSSVLDAEIHIIDTIRRLQTVDVGSDVKP